MADKKQKVQSEEYQNKLTINQRGATIDINNSTNREALNLSQWSGSNIKLTNTVTSELATNNKQVQVNNDSFETVKNNKAIYAGKDIVLRAGENVYNLKGFKDNDEIEAAKEWKEAYKPIANNNAQSETLRGGKSYPGGISTPQAGARSPNPTENQEVYVADSKYPDVAYGLLASLIPPQRRKILDEVELYSRVIPIVTPDCYKVKNPSQEDIDSGSGGGGYGSNAPGAMQYPGENASTERGTWAPNPAHEEQKQQLIDVQKTLQPIEERMGNGGDEEEFVYRDKVEVIGAAFNDYPSIRVDPKGRTVPAGKMVGRDVSYVNTDSVPHVEEVDNDSMYPVGNYDLTVGNRYNVKVGSGGVQIKSTGGVEIGGTTFKVAANKTNIQSADGVNISSESIVEIQSKNNISLRSNRQIYIEPSLGVKNNTVIGGSSYTEGEIYANHITAPAEIQQTEQVELYGQLKAGLVMNATLVGFPDSDGDIISSPGVIILNLDTDLTGPPNGVQTYPHSHHFKNLPLRLTESNNDVKQIAQAEGINVNGYQGSAECVVHQYKEPVAFESDSGGGGGGEDGSEGLREGIKPADVSPRCLFVPPGTRLTNDRNRVQSDGVLKQQFPELPKEGIKPNEQDLTEDEIQELINAAKATIGIGAQPSTPDQGAESTDTGTTDY
tara:strand:- start:861 stop:2861 length:2001 start_codon:yes stop_codon:yes gene_type:complete